MKYSIVVDYEQRVSKERDRGRLDINIGSKCLIFSIMNEFGCFCCCSGGLGALIGVLVLS